MTERQPSVSYARIENHFGVNIFHLPQVIYKTINLHTDNYKLIWLYVFEIKTVVYISRKLVCCVLRTTQSYPAQKTLAIQNSTTNLSSA